MPRHGRHGSDPSSCSSVNQAFHQMLSQLGFPRKAHAPAVVFDYREPRPFSRQTSCSVSGPQKLWHINEVHGEQVAAATSFLNQFAKTIKNLTFSATPPSFHDAPLWVKCWHCAYDMWPKRKSRKNLHKVFRVTRHHCNGHSKKCVTVFNTKYLIIEHKQFMKMWWHTYIKM